MENRINPNFLVVTVSWNDDDEVSIRESRYNRPTMTSNVIMDMEFKSLRHEITLVLTGLETENWLFECGTD